MTGRLRGRAWAVACILVAIAVRGWDVDHMSIWQDEGLSLYRAGLDARGILSGTIPLGELVTRDVQPPLYFLLLAGWLRLVEPATWAARWLSVFAGLPAVALTWALARRWVGPAAAGVAALLAALSPAYLWYGQEIRNYSLQVTLGLVAVYALTRTLGHGLARSPAPSLRATAGWSALCVVANAALVWTHYLGFCLLAFEAAVVAAHVARKRAWRVIVPLAAMALAALPLVPYALWRLGVGPERDQRFVPLAVMLQDVVRGFAFGKSADQTAWAVGALNVGFAALALLGAAALWRRARPSAGFLVAYLGVPVLALYGLTTLKPVYMGVRHILLVSPAFYILVAAGAAALADPWSLASRARRAAAVLAVLAAAGGMAHADANTYSDARFAKDDLRGLARYVDDRAVAGDVLLVSDPVLVLSLEQLVTRVPVQAMPPFLPSGLADARPPAEQLAPVLARYGRVWFMTPHDDMSEWLEANTLHVDSRAFHGSTIPVRVEAFERAPSLRTAAAPTRRPTVHLGGLDLLGWDVVPEPAVAGEPARVRAVWQVTDRGLADLKVAFNLKGADGNTYAEGDHAPFHGLRPTSEWPFGELVFEPHDLGVSPTAPPGMYTLTATVYDPATGATFPPGGPAELGSVTLARRATPVSARELDIPRRLNAHGAGLAVLGFAGPESGGGPRPAGARLPLSVWIRVDDPARLPARLRVEAVDAWGRVKAGVAADLGTDADPAASWAPGDVRQVRLALDLPGEAGRFALRLVLETGDGARAWLRRGRPAVLPVRAVWLDRVEVAAPRIETAAPPIEHRLDLAVGDAVQLLGYDLAVDALRPSGTLTATLYWRSGARVPEPYHVTVQLVPLDPATREPAGPPVAQHDGAPAGGARPTTGWVPGEVVTDRHALALPPDVPPGDYLLIAALYDPDRPDRPRPPVTQGGLTRDFVVLDRLTIAPDGEGNAP